MKLIPTSLPGVLLIEPRVFGDERGYFLESWNRLSFSSFGIAADFVQDNQSFSAHNILRGLHHQKTRPQGKLVWALEGEILDVVVDLRRSSPTFGKWVSMRLSSQNFLRAWIPPGLAHGFRVLSKSAHFCYKCTEYYHPEDEEVIAWDDPDLAIDWEFDGALPILSARDAAGQSFANAHYHS